MAVNRINTVFFFVDEESLNRDSTFERNVPKKIFWGVYILDTFCWRVNSHAKNYRATLLSKAGKPN